MTQRVLVGLIGAPIVLSLVVMGSMPLAVLALFISVVGAFEYASLGRTKDWSPSMPVLIGGAALFVLDAAFWGGAHADIVTGLVLLSSLCVQVLRGVPANSLAGPSLETFGALYCGWAMSKFYLIRSTFNQAGMGLALLTIILIWLDDMGAFFVGRKYGRTRLAPHLSPKKTVEGSVGGLVWAVVGSVLFKLIGDASGLWYTLTWPHAIAIGVIVAVCGQVGDLAESAMKRDAGVKDAGWLLPGHGGILDRFDSFFFAVPVAYYYFLWALGRLLDA